jgi:threonine synthase
LLPRILRGFEEFETLGLVSGPMPKFYAAQPEGSAPVIRALDEGADFPEPVRPATIAKSLAIGNPADGFQVLAAVRRTGGGGVAVSDDEILDSIDLLARTEGIFTEPAGGTTLAATRKLIASGAIPRNESIVVVITGNGYKTAEVMRDRVDSAVRVGRSVRDFEAVAGDAVASLSAAGRG